MANGKIIKRDVPVAVAITPNTEVTIVSQNCYKVGKILMCSIWFKVPSELLAAGSKLLTLDSVSIAAYQVNNTRLNGSIPDNTGGIACYFIFSDNSLYVDNNYALNGGATNRGVRLDFTLPLA